MKQSFSQIQEQKQTQQLRLTQQQLLAVTLLELPIDILEQNISDEMILNPALEQYRDDDTQDFEPLDIDNSQDNSYEQDNKYKSEYESDEKIEAQDDADKEKEIEANEQEELNSEMEKSLERMDNDDEPYNNEYDNYDGIEYKEVENRDQQSFIDTLNEQVGELELTDDEHIIMKFLIGSIDNNGFITEDNSFIKEHVYLEEYLDVEEEDIEKVIKKLQTFDPAGIGARNLRECMLIQIGRMEEGMVKKMLTTIITDYYDEFIKNHWDKMQKQLAIGDEQIDTLRNAIKHRLNPKPGAALGEAVGVSLNQITPDFIIETTEDGRIKVEINDLRLPKLFINNEFYVMINNYKNINDNQLNRKDQEAKQYLSDCISKGNMYIEAIKIRTETLKKTITAIVNWQKNYFLEGDEQKLKPMRLEDIASKTQLDISTVSRATRDKYVQSQWGIKELKSFFTKAIVTEDGEEIATNDIKQTLKEIIDSENKKKPYSDEALVKMMEQKGLPIARRTITKYREQMEIPSSRLRKQ